ncbi:MAG: MBL fold metallo-hydrolase, partial [Actinomycetota bacterium]|nr:MBL fold metallo-hydrolase [Actinomycetota bacterium]
TARRHPAAMVNVTFHGVRGSAPIGGRSTGRYGARTACVAVEVPKREPILLDLGTGLHRWVATLSSRVPSRVHALLTHPHAGHVEGWPALRAVEDGGARVDVYGPPEVRRPGGAGDGWRVIAVEDEELAVGEAKVMVRSVAHGGPTNGYRLTVDGVSVAYVSDHQAPPGLDTISHQVLELADRVDLLIHDAQLSTAMWGDRSGDGHSTVDYAVLVAREAGARCLALFHHDPGHDDDQIDLLAAGARRTAERLGVDEVIAAAEGTTVSFDR